MVDILRRQLRIALEEYFQRVWQRRRQRIVYRIEGLDKLHHDNYGVLNGHRVAACFLRCEFVVLPRRVLVVGLCKQPEVCECGPAGPCNTLRNHKHPCQPTNMATFDKIFANFRRLDQENGEVESVFYSMSVLRHHCCIEWQPTWFSGAHRQAEKYSIRKRRIASYLAMFLKVQVSGQRVNTKLHINRNISALHSRQPCKCHYWACLTIIKLLLL